MGIFTVSNNKNIEEKIQGDLDIICDEILINTTPVSIILTGSFGRGEGSVIEFNTRILPLNDYDILLLVKEKIPEHVLKNIEGRIYDRLHYSRPETRKIVFSDFTISLFQTTLDDIKSYANVGSYEVKTRSRLLYGTDFRHKISLTTNDIPVATGFHFLFNKLIHLLGNFSSTYLKKPPQGMEKIFLIYTCGKAYIEMGTALSILTGDYRPGYSDRNEFFRTAFSRIFPELEKKSPELYRKIDFFTRLKLSPDPDRYSALDPVALWFETRNDLLNVIDYYLQACNGKKSGTDRISLSDDLYLYTKKNYFHGQFKYFIRVKFGVNSDLLATIVNCLYQRYSSVEFYYQSKYQERNTLSVLMESPILKIFSLATVLLDSLNQSEAIDCRLLDHFNREFKKIVCDRTVHEPETDWDYARLNLISAAEIYRRLR